MFRIEPPMFFSKPNRLPAELIFNIINRLSSKDAISLLMVSKEMNAYIKDDRIWQKFGAANFQEFVE